MTAAAVRMTNSPLLTTTSGPLAKQGSIAPNPAFLEGGLVEVAARIPAHPARTGSAGVSQAPGGAMIAAGIPAVVRGDTALDPFLMMSAKGSGAHA